MRPTSFVATFLVAIVNIGFVTYGALAFGGDTQFELRVDTLHYYTHVGVGPNNGNDPGDHPKLTFDITAGTQITSGFKGGEIQADKNKDIKLDKDIAHSGTMADGDYTVLLSLHEHHDTINLGGFSGNENRGDVLLIVTRKNNQLTARFDPKHRTTKDRVVLSDDGIDFQVHGHPNPKEVIFGYTMKLALSYKDSGGNPVAVTIKKE